MTKPTSHAAPAPDFAPRQAFAPGPAFFLRPLFGRVHAGISSPIAAKHSGAWRIGAWRRAAHWVLAILPVLAVVMVNGGAIAAAAKPSVPRADPVVLQKLEALMERPFTGHAGTSTIIADLRGTRDARLTPYFIKISHAKKATLQLAGLLAANYVSRDAKLIDIKTMLQIPAGKILTLAIAVLARHGTITPDQLRQIVALAPQPSQRLMAASELVDRGLGASAATALFMLMSSSRASVRYFAALKLVQADTSMPDTHNALQILDELVTRPEIRLNSLKSALLERVATNKDRICEPWVVALSEAKASSFSVRLEASLVLLQLHNFQGVKSWQALAASHKGVIHRIELGLLALEYASQFKPSDIRRLGTTRSPLLRGIIRAADMAASGKDFLPAIDTLITQGQPLFLNWVLDYAQKPHCPYRGALLRSLIEYSTIADGQTGQDFRRGEQAALLLLNLKHPSDRRTIKRCLNAFNPGVVAAVLTAMLSPTSHNFSSMIRPHWHNFMHRHHRRIRLLAGLVMGKYQQPIALPELRKVVLYGGRISAGLRAQAGWYYASLTHSTPAVLAAVLGRSGGTR